MYDRSAFGGELAGRISRHVLRGVRELMRDLPIPLDVAQILRGGDEGQIPGPSKARASDLSKLDAVRRRRELLEVVEGLLVRGQLEVGADGEAEDGFRLRDLGADGREMPRTNREEAKPTRSTRM